MFTIHIADARCLLCVLSFLFYIFHAIDFDYNVMRYNILINKHKKVHTFGCADMPHAFTIKNQTARNDERKNENEIEFKSPSKWNARQKPNLLMCFRSENGLFSHIVTHYTSILLIHTSNVSITPEKHTLHHKWNRGGGDSDVDYVFYFDHLQWKARCVDVQHPIFSLSRFQKEKAPKRKHTWIGSNSVAYIKIISMEHAALIDHMNESTNEWMKNAMMLPELDELFSVEIKNCD